MLTGLIVVKPRHSVAIGDKVIVSKPEGSDDPVGWHPFLDRHVGRPLTVRDIAHGSQATYVFLWEISQPVRKEWVSPA